MHNEIFNIGNGLLNVNRNGTQLVITVQLRADGEIAVTGSIQIVR